MPRTFRGKKRAKRSRPKRRTIAKRSTPAKPTSWWGKVKEAVPGGALSALGTGVGTLFGMPAAGGMAGKLASQILGFGDYQVKSNALMNVPMGTTVPTFGSMSQGVLISHREFIGDLVAPGTVAWTNKVYHLNPGLVDTFPFLSQIGRQFDQYQFEGVIVEFRSTASDYATGTALGSVVIASEYDAADPPYASKSEAENSQYCSSNKPSESFIHPIECDPSVNVLPQLYTRYAGVPSGKDIRMYDHCTVNIATVGNGAAAGTVLGELWINYQVRLFKPQLGPQSLVDHFQIDTTTVTTSNRFGTSDTLPTSYSSLGGQIDTSVGSGVYKFPPNLTSGNYLCIYYATGASTVLTTQMLWGFLTNCSAKTLVANNTQSNVCPAGGATDTQAICEKFVTITGRDAYLGISQGTLPGTLATLDVYIIQLPANLN